MSGRGLRRTKGVKNLHTVAFSFYCIMMASNPEEDSVECILLVSIFAALEGRLRLIILLIMTLKGTVPSMLSRSQSFHFL